MTSTLVVVGRRTLDLEPLRIETQETTLIRNILYSISYVTKDVGIRIINDNDIYIYVTVLFNNKSQTYHAAHSPQLHQTNKKKTVTIYVRILQAHERPGGLYGRQLSLGKQLIFAPSPR